VRLNEAGAPEDPRSNCCKRVYLPAAFSTARTRAGDIGAS
jgi:hypothetical protein